GITEQTTTADFLPEGTWYDFFSGDAVTVGAPAEALTLLPGEFHVYTSEPVDSPEPGLITVDAESHVAELPRATILDQNYPNPFAGETHIEYSVAAPGHVALEVFDVLGRRVRVLIDEPQGVGRFAVALDGGDLAPGTYLYRLKT